MIPKPEKTGLGIKKWPKMTPSFCERGYNFW